MKINYKKGRAARIRQYVKASQLGYDTSCIVKDTPVKQVWVREGKTSVQVKIPFWEAMA